MKNKYQFLTVVLLLFFVGLGCRFYDASTGSTEKTNSTAPKEKDLSDKVINKTVGEERIGVPECDELLDFFDEQTQSEDENYIVKATRAFYFNKIRESFKKDLEESKDNPDKKKDMAKNCRDYKAQIDKFKAEEDNKETEKLTRRR